ncbi:hypothetical protein Bpfe_012594, partial [Biomphalaria pfeifferi]
MLYKKQRFYWLNVVTCYDHVIKKKRRGNQSFIWTYGSNVSVREGVKTRKIPLVSITGEGSNTRTARVNKGHLDILVGSSYGSLITAIGK